MKTLLHVAGVSSIGPSASTPMASTLIDQHLLVVGQLLDMLRNHRILRIEHQRLFELLPRHFGMSAKPRLDRLLHQLRDQVLARDLSRRRILLVSGVERRRRRERLIGAADNRPDRAASRLAGRASQPCALASRSDASPAGMHSRRCSVCALRTSPMSPDVGSLRMLRRFVCAAAESGISTFGFR